MRLSIVLLVGLLALIGAPTRTEPIESAQLEAYSQLELLLEHGVLYSSKESIRAARSHEAIRKSLETILGQTLPKAETSRSAEVRGEFRKLLGQFIQLNDLKDRRDARRAFKGLSHEIGQRLVEVEKLAGKRLAKVSDYLASIVATYEESKVSRDEFNNGDNYEQSDNHEYDNEDDESATKEPFLKRIFNLFT